MTKANFDKPLPILVGVRVRLDDQQRQALKSAYYTARNSEQRSSVTPNRGSVTVVTNTTTELDKRLGMTQLVMQDLLNSRDTISLPVLLKLQYVLEVEVVNRKQLDTACKSYLDYVYSQASND